MEHRWGERLTFVQPVNVLLNGSTSPGSTSPARLVSTSVSGALIECGLVPPLYTNVRVVLPAHDTRGPAELVACVLRHAPGAFAVEWRDMASPAIVALLARKSGHDLETLCRDAAWC
jgi:hypothetical protein